MRVSAYNHILTLLAIVWAAKLSRLTYLNCEEFKWFGIVGVIVLIGMYYLENAVADKKERQGK